MKIQYRLIILFVLLVSAGCVRSTTPQSMAPTDTPSADELATQVSAILTAMATASPQAEQPSVTPQVIVETPTPNESINITNTPNPTETSSPTDTPNPPTNTPEPTNTFTPEATFVPGDPRRDLGSPTWVDNFINLNNWPTGDDTYTKIELKRNHLVLTALNEYDGWRMTWPEVKNFYLEMTAHMPECKGTDHYGMIFRVPDRLKPAQGYLFGITCDGKFSLRKWDDPDMSSLIRWKASDSIDTGPGATNRLGVWVKGNLIKMYVNGNMVGEFTDSTFTTKGGFGLFVGSDEIEKLAVWVSQISYWDIQ